MITVDQEKAKVARKMNGFFGQIVMSFLIREPANARAQL